MEDKSIDQPKYKIGQKFLWQPTMSPNDKAIICTAPVYISSFNIGVNNSYDDIYPYKVKFLYPNYIKNITLSQLSMNNDTDEIMTRSDELKPLTKRHKGLDGRLMYG